METGFETLQTGTTTFRSHPQAIEPLSDVAEDGVVTAQPIKEPWVDSIVPRKGNKHHRRRVGFSFTSPTWWLGRVYILTKYQTYSGWDFSFRTYTAIPSSSPVFEYCQRGDVENLQKLFEKKQASPFVVNEDGMTPLDVSHMAIVEVNLTLAVCGKILSTRLCTIPPIFGCRHEFLCQALLVS